MSTEERGVCREDRGNVGVPATGEKKSQPGHPFVEVSDDGRLVTDQGAELPEEPRYESTEQQYVETFAVPARNTYVTGLPQLLSPLVQPRACTLDVEQNNLEMMKIRVF